jgi:hypothetical protein
MYTFPLFLFVHPRRATVFDGFDMLLHASSYSLDEFGIERAAEGGRNYFVNALIKLQRTDARSISL